MGHGSLSAVSTHQRDSTQRYQELTWIEISTIYRGTVADSVANGDRSGSLHHRPNKRIRDPRDDDLEGGDCAHGHEEHAKESRAHTGGTTNYSVANS